MAIKQRARHAGATCLALLAVACLWPGVARAVSNAADKLHDAEDHERAGRWEEAGAVYEQLFKEDGRAETRDRFLLCQRHLLRVRRHQDPIYRQQLQDVPFSQALKTYAEVLGKLQAHYLDREKVVAARLFQRGLEELRLALEDAAFSKDYAATSRPALRKSFRDYLVNEWHNKTIRDAAEARKAAAEIALEAQRTLGLKPTIAVFEFICGACGGLDEYTAYLHPARLVNEGVSLAGALADIGVQVEIRDRQLVITQVAPGTPAAVAGIRAGDRITRVDQKTLDRLPAEVVAALLTGEPGGTIELDVLPAGAITAVSCKLVRRSVFYRMMDRPDQKEGVPEEGIGYLQLIGFQKTTLHEVEEAILRLKRDGGMRVLILDLRGNPGGSFRVAVQVAERFLADGVIVSAQSQVRGYNRTFESHSGLNAIDVPLVVLVDGDTASAAELLAGALKENQRAVLIGTTTYGKGTIQTVLPLTNLPADTPAALRVTLARFFSPRGNAYNGIGVAPHRVVNEKDGQLQVALQEAAELLKMLRD